MKKVQAWKELSRKQVFKKFSRKIDEVFFELPDGSTADFYVKNEGTAASVLALTKDNQVVLVRQFRVGPKQILNELPGGFVDPDESPQDTARREFIEETGYDGDFEFVETCLDDAYSTMVRYCYVAKNCHKVGEPQDTQTEQTEVVLMQLHEFREHLRKGQLTDVEMGYMGLDYLGLL
ncbi:MAG TPA: NUDIX hydrolase [Candidatus Saccharimonadales bacterium]|nr:NUDIX hydrolase [Candidatus Saccharimonadales bacterium]